MKRKIFVQIAAYRDPELPFTIADLISKAAFPNGLRIGLCNQGTEEDWKHPVLKDRRVRQHRIPYTASQGVCWARSRVQEFYEGEAYTLQIDSHHRFEPGWDRTLMRMMDSVQSAKPLFSAYLPHYEGAGEAAAPMVGTPGKQVFTYFDHDGVVHFNSRGLEENERFSPARARFVSGHFIFAHGAFVEEVPYDPTIYFSGEEITLAVRAYTHGYDLFHPSAPIAYHSYGRRDQRRHWNDHTPESGEVVPRLWMDYQGESVRRIMTVLTQPEKVPAPYGLGSERSLRDYETYAGINFRRQCVHANTLEGLEPPSSRLWNWEDAGPLCERREGTVWLDTKSLVPDRRSTFWYFGLHDECGVELLRIDLTDPQVLAGKLRAIPVRFWSARPPMTYTLIPHRKRGGWGESIVCKLTRRNYRPGHVR